MTSKNDDDINYIISTFKENIREKQKKQALEAAKNKEQILKVINACKDYIEEFTNDENHWNVHSVKFAISACEKQEVRLYPYGHPEKVIFTGKLYYIYKAYEIMSAGYLGQSSHIYPGGYIALSW